MIRLVLRSLAADPVRTLLSVLGLAAAVVLVLVFEGFSEGFYAQLRAYPASVDADLVVMRAGVKNLAAATSALPQDTRARLEAVDGVRTAHPLGGLPLIYERGGQRTPVYVVAFTSKGGPPGVIAGARPSPGRHVVVDAGLADKYGFVVGDSVDLAGERFEIAGLSTGTAALFTPYVFVRLEDLVDIAVARSLANGEVPTGFGVGCFLIDVEPGANVAAVRAHIEAAIDVVDVLTSAEIARNDVRMGKRMMGGVMGLLVGVAWLIALLVVGIVLWTSVLARFRELGTIKAVGSSTGQLVGWLLLEATLLVAVAFVLGAFASGGVALAIEHVSPSYLVRPWELGALLRTAAAVLVAAWVGAALPARRIAQLDPAQVFSR